MIDKYYYELTITPNSQFNLFSDFLLQITQNAIEQKSDSIIIRDIEPLDDILWATNEFAKRLDIKIKTKLTKHKNQNWIKKYQQSIKPIKVGSFYIRASWEKEKNGYINIIIDPALAFGSGHHESTFSTLLAIEKYVKKYDAFLDVGCGSGILAISALKKGAIVDICDTDETALTSAKENFKLNSSTYNLAWVGSANKSTKKYDIVVANIIADVIIMIKDDLKNRLKDSGYLILSGILDKYLNKIIVNFSDFNIVQNLQKGDWHTIVLKRKINAGK